MPIEHRCRYPSCGFKSFGKNDVRRHEARASMHCHPGMKFTLVCNAEGGCGQKLYTGAYRLEAIERFFDQSNDSKEIMCLSCTAKNEKKKTLASKPTSEKKRKRSEPETVASKIQRMVVASEELGSTFRLVDSVAMDELIGFYRAKSTTELNAISLNDVKPSRSPVALFQLYTRDPNGGGVGVHHAVRLYWHTALNTAQHYSLINPGSYNCLLVAFQMYGMFYGKAPGAPKDVKEFIKQSLAIKRHGVSVLLRRGESNFIVNKDA